jgi:hypothetical protein
MADVVEIDATTGEIIERDYTAEEKAQKAADLKAYKAAEKAALEAEKARQAALDKLTTLGLTEADLAALGVL